MLLLDRFTDNVFRGKFTKLTISLLLLIGIAATLILPTEAALIGFYYDNESGNSFKMPTGWTYELTEDDFFEATFLPNNTDTAISMQYSSRDIWSMLTAEQQGNIARTDIGNSFFSVDSIAELLDISSKQISKKKLGQYEYFVAETAESVTAYGYKFTMYAVNFITVNKGWMYWYRFGADSNHYINLLKIWLQVQSTENPHPRLLQTV